MTLCKALTGTERTRVRFPPPPVWRSTRPVTGREQVEEGDMKASIRNYKRVRRGLPSKKSKLRRDTEKSVRRTLVTLANKKREV